MENKFSSESCLVLVSGGQDSTTCLFWAKKQFKEVYGISFFYGQKHSAEIDIAAEICREQKIQLKKIDISFMADLVKSNLFSGNPDVNRKHELSEDLPSSFVPYRNMIFLTLASAWASTLGILHVITGVSEAESSGYADCRDIFIKSLQVSLNLSVGLEENNVKLHTPLMELSKAETFRLAEELGCLDYIINRTLTCYNGIMKMNDYGMGCGDCPACILRKNGYRKYKGETGK